MAAREALKELQARLAKRLQAAQTEGMSVTWLAVRAGGHNYLLPLGQAGEIVPLPPVQIVPYARDWFKGVVSVRGNLVGLVDLAAFVAANQGPQARPSVGKQEASIVTLNATLEVNCALRVDSLAGLRSDDAFASVSPADAGAPPFFGNCFVDADGQRWQELNLQALALFPPFLQVGV